MGGIGSLLLAFLQIGMFSIGGGYAVIPMIQDQVVARHGWVSQQVFTDIITISQMTPGPLAVNTSTFVGIRIGGIAGAVAATFGCVVSGVSISLLLYALFQKNKESVYAFEVLNGLKSASSGLIISAAATILLLTFFGTSALDSLDASGIDWIAVLIFGMSFVALRIWKVNPILLMLVTGGLGIMVYGGL